MPWESAPPFALIIAMLGGMGGIQAGVHKLFHGKPKAVGADAWDRAAEKRDARVLAQQQAGGAPAGGKVREVCAGAQRAEPGVGGWQG
jgi:NADH dehydrogenase (ubiquinone) 1 alpha subcomplex subunit 1